jgi:hypothetical protein
VLSGTDGATDRASQLAQLCNLARPYGADLLDGQIPLSPGIAAEVEASNAAENMDALALKARTPLGAMRQRLSWTYCTAEIRLVGTVRNSKFRLQWVR